MRVIDQARLWFREGTSDKVYEVDLVEVATGQYVVNFRFGRRGGALKDGTKTSLPLPLDKARGVFQKLVDEKLAGGYQHAARRRPPAPAPAPATDAGGAARRDRAKRARLIGHLRQGSAQHRAARAGRLARDRSRPRARPSRSCSSCSASTFVPKELRRRRSGGTCSSTALARCGSAPRSRRALADRRRDARSPAAPARRGAARDRADRSGARDATIAARVAPCHCWPRTIAATAQRSRARPRSCSTIDRTQARASAVALYLLDDAVARPGRARDRARRAAVECRGVDRARAVPARRGAPRRRALRAARAPHRRIRRHAPAVLARRRASTCAAASRACCAGSVARHRRTTSRWRRRSCSATTTKMPSPRSAASSVTSTTGSRRSTRSTRSSTRTARATRTRTTS